LIVGIFRIGHLRGDDMEGAAELAGEVGGEPAASLGLVHAPGALDEQNRLGVHSVSSSCSVSVDFDRRTAVTVQHLRVQGHVGVTQAQLLGNSGAISLDRCIDDALHLVASVEVRVVTAPRAGSFPWLPIW
jgi:hypothetical protein